MIRPVTPTEWRDAAGGVGCGCHHHEPDTCAQTRWWTQWAPESCACSCHVRPDLRVLAPAPQETTR